MSIGWAAISRLNVYLVKSTLHASQRAHHGAVLWRKPVITLASRGFVKTSRLCRPCNPDSLERISPWKLLQLTGIKKCQIIKFRRYMKRYTYPWLGYSVPAAFILATGDLLAQYYCGSNAKEMTLSCFYKKCWDRERTLVYFLLGMFLVGPVLSWWNLFWYRKLRCKKRLTYIVTKSLLDVLVLGPILLAAMALLSDQTTETNILKQTWEESETRVKGRYLPAIMTILTMNLMTRPVVFLALCFLVPRELRQPFRAVYEFLIAVYLSQTFANNKLRAPNPPPPPPPPSPAKAKLTQFTKMWKWPC